MNKKTYPIFLTFIALLMVPLRVSAMKPFFEEKKEGSENGSASAAAVRERERLATDPGQDDPRNFTSAGINESDSGGEMDGMSHISSAGASGTEVPNNENTAPSQGASSSGSAIAVVTNNRRQQDQILRASGAYVSLQNLDPVTQVRLSNIERVRSQASALVEGVKKKYPAFAGIIDEWRQSDDLATRDIILKMLILAPSTPQAERAQRKEIAGLLQRAAQMEEGVAQMEQVGIDETWSDAEATTSAKIVQVPSPRIRAEQALQALQRENELHQKAVNTFVRLTRPIKTMACLQALDFSAIPMSPISDAFMTANQGADWGNIPLILNNGEPPVRLIIPASSDQSTYTSVIPAIIPAGTRTIVNGVTTIAPVRAPTPEENQQVRRLIKEALQAHYGAEVSKLFSDLELQAYYGPEENKKLFSDFDRVDTPLMASEISEIFSMIEEKYQENENQNGTVPAEASQIPTLLRDVDALKNSVTKESDEAKRLEAQALFKQTSERLASPNKVLTQAAWHAGETVARGAGVVGGTIAGISSKATRGALVGAAIPATLVAGGLIGRNAGALIGNIVGLNEMEANQSIIGSYLALAAVPFVPHASLLAVAAAISGFGAVGGATPSVYRTLPVAAKRALNYYAPGAALEKTKEALRDWGSSSEMIARTLTLMQQAQETDLEAMEALHDFFESVIPLVSNAAVADEMQHNLSSSSSAVVPVKKMKADERTITPETLPPAQARDILVDQIKLRALYREDLMTRLQNKMEAIKEREQQIEEQSRATFQSSDFRTRYPRGL